MPGGGGHLHAGRGPDGTSADAEGKTWIDPAQLYGPDTATGSPAGAGASYPERQETSLSASASAPAGHHVKSRRSARQEAEAPCQR